MVDTWRELGLLDSGVRLGILIGVGRCFRCFVVLLRDDFRDPEFDFGEDDFRAPKLLLPRSLNGIFESLKVEVVDSLGWT